MAPGKSKSYGKYNKLSPKASSNNKQQSTKANNNTNSSSNQQGDSNGISGVQGNKKPTTVRTPTNKKRESTSLFRRQPVDSKSKYDQNKYQEQDQQPFGSSVLPQPELSTENLLGEQHVAVKLPDQIFKRLQSRHDLTDSAKRDGSVESLGEMPSTSVHIAPEIPPMALTSVGQPTIQGSSNEGKAPHVVTEFVPAYESVPGQLRASPSPTYDANLYQHNTPNNTKNSGDYKQNLDGVDKDLDSLTKQFAKQSTNDGPDFVVLEGSKKNRKQQQESPEVSKVPGPRSNPNDYKTTNPNIRSKDKAQKASPSPNPVPLIKRTSPTVRSAVPPGRLSPGRDNKAIQLKRAPGKQPTPTAGGGNGSIKQRSQDQPPSKEKEKADSQLSQSNGGSSRPKSPDGKRPLGYPNRDTSNTSQATNGSGKGNVKVGPPKRPGGGILKNGSGNPPPSATTTRQTRLSPDFEQQQQQEKSEKRSYSQPTRPSPGTNPANVEPKFSASQGGYPQPQPVQSQSNFNPAHYGSGGGGKGGPLRSSVSSSGGYSAPRHGSPQKKSEPKDPEEKNTRQMYDRNTLRNMNASRFAGGIHRWTLLAKPPFPPPSNVPIAVYVRKRPFFDKEKEKGEYDVVNCSLSNSQQEICVSNCLFKADLKTPYIMHNRFTFDHVFNERATNQQVYDSTALGLVKHSLGGGLACMFMFGQTGSGKTYTMSALEKRAAEDIFKHYTTNEPSMTPKLSFVEIAGNSCYDLLTDHKSGEKYNPEGVRGSDGIRRREEIRIRENPDGSYSMHGIAEVLVKGVSDLQHLIKSAHSRRKTLGTEANDTSSRSHAVCVIELPRMGGDNGRLIFVDCAGTERAKDSMYHSKELQYQGAEINASLYALKECIRIYNQNKKPPFRMTALTKVLAQAFILPQAKLSVICTVSPSCGDTEHSLGTLKTGN